MKIAGKTYNTQGQLIDVFECIKHNNRNTSGVCMECEKELEALQDISYEDYLQEEAENGLI